MRYRIKALHPGTGVTATTVEALDEAEATARLQRDGAQVLSIVAERGRCSMMAISPKISPGPNREKTCRTPLPPEISTKPDLTK